MCWASLPRVKSHPQAMKSEMADLEVDMRVERRLGCGHFDEVCLMRHVRSGFTCAAKYISKHRFDDFKAKRGTSLECNSECNILNQLGQPNIQSVYDMVVKPDVVVLLLEYVNGICWAQALIEGGAHPDALTLSLLHQVSCAVSCAVS